MLSLDEMAARKRARDRREFALVLLETVAGFLLLFWLFHATGQADKARCGTVSGPGLEVVAVHEHGRTRCIVTDGSRELYEIPIKEPEQ